ncbi:MULTISPECIES: lysozyme inhibitor LprI family protein [Sutcliffiella]|uniref:Lysozyme inhibitor LprI-like N-terminal domain-containing protein n=1 Tax=Sutcliffiella cohnii TaxID=33932 RepID=A0A223KNG9_9BACI|nr:MULTISPECIES: lysozyme inhibitor LprI family protein [Sutcliffiella]AST90898.1 hypothetical protein BC6307_06180 [Sutcliffiella cohnii]MED4017808.1 DUF1311 domain-containing protein [Sutcliffiella cohnii]WBL16684.1 DUF1311 domain-containing protein [Sutcliffiella sp. NC1]
MRSNKRILVAILTLLFVFLTACNSATEESIADMDNENTEPTQKINEESPKVDSPNNTDTDNNNDADSSSEEVSTPSESTPTTTEDSSTVSLVSAKDEYLEKLQDTKKELDALEAEGSATYALKKVEDDKWEAWDTLLNEVYGVLQEQLSTEEMDELRAEQRGWIQYRDETALEASSKYKGGTQEHLEYVAVLAVLTEERCFELVEEYMR